MRDTSPSRPAAADPAKERKLAEWEAELAKREQALEAREADTEGSASDDPEA